VRAIVYAARFHEQREFIRWYRSSHIRPPQRLADMPTLRCAKAENGVAEYDLARRVRPNERGGLAGCGPLIQICSSLAAAHAGAFGRADRAKNTGLSATQPTRQMQPRCGTTTFGGADKLEMLVDPRNRAIGRALIIMRCDGLTATVAVTMEHPGDEQRRQRC